MENKKTVWNSEYFCGKRISNYGLQNGYIDYHTLASSFDAVLANNIRSATNYEDWELVNGSDYYYYDKEGNIYNTEDEIEEAGIGYSDLDIEYNEYYQEYIISESGYKILSDYTNEIVWYNEKLDLYLWSVSHFGTSWDYVLTDIKIELNNKE